MQSSLSFLIPPKAWCGRVDIISFYINVKIFLVRKLEKDISPLPLFPPVFCSWKEDLGCAKKDIVLFRFTCHDRSIGEIKVEIVF